MRTKNSIKNSFFAMVFVFFTFALMSIVSADLDLAINAEISGFSTDFRAVTDSSSSTGYDGFDLVLPVAPSNYSNLYSVVSGNSLSVDAWPASSNPRTLNLVYENNPQTSGTLDLSWDFSDDDFNATLKDFGTDSSRTTQVGSDVNMKADSSYSVSSNGIRYFTLTVTNNTVEEGTENDTGGDDTGGSTGGGGASGGGGGTQEVPRSVVLKLIHAGDLSVDKKDLIILPVTVSNEGQLTLNGIILSVTATKNGVPTREVGVSLDKTSINSLSPGQSEALSLTIKMNAKEEGEYKVVINAVVADPAYSESDNIRITVKEGKKVEDKILFIEDLISKNPECAEVKEISDQARALLNDKDLVSAEKKVDEAVYACEKILFEKRLSNYLSEKKGHIVLYSVIAAILVLLGAGYYYYKKRKFFK